jgi:hypothetical protein
MRTTKETLLRLARDTAAISANQDHSIICIYLTGSLVTENPFIGGTTDVDLFFVHTEKPIQRREIRYLSDDVTLDIAHVEQTLYQQPRHLRADAWLGPFLCAKPKVLYDTRHWFEFTEASVGAQFYRPEYMLERARSLAAAARRIWTDFHLSPPEITPFHVQEYLHCIELAGNAVALLSGAPLPLRHFFLDLPMRTQVVKRPDLFDLFSSTILPENRKEVEWQQWIPDWIDTLRLASTSKECPPCLTSPRRNYYSKAVDSLWEVNPAAASWILMQTWNQSSALISSESESIDNWREACSAFLQINGSFEPALERIDHLLDSVEETLDVFSSENGLTE